MFENRTEVVDALDNHFGNGVVLVVGDVMLDRYLWGEVARISPEAPVPVVRLKRETEGCGGAANVALNLASLGLKPVLAGKIGRDEEGRRLVQLLQEQGVDTALLEDSPASPTITKTRIVGGHQQMLRVDREESCPSRGEGSEEFGERIVACLNSDEPPAAVILSDYGKGTLSSELCRRMIEGGAQAGIPVLVDPKGSDYERYRGATCLSPNRLELATAAGLEGGSPLDRLLDAGEALRDRLEIGFLTATLSEMGIALMEPEEPPRRIPAMAREVFDVSGAGDTVIATFAAGLSADLSRMDALHLANVAAGVVVGKLGTTPISRPELRQALESEQELDEASNIVTLEEARHQVEQWRGKGMTVVFTNGCFDLLHAGHVTYLEKARKLGNRLVVGLNTDHSVRELKGPSRPVINEHDRARVLAALASVDLVVLFDEETPLNLIGALKPDILAKGADYAEDEVVGGDEVKSWGGQVKLVDLVEGHSTSRIVEVIQDR